MRLFGLTGGIASGKSAVGRRFRARGLPVIDADVLAREAVAPSTPGLAALVDTFGSTILDPSGALDRRALAALVFGSEERRRQVNAIVHPRVGALTMAAAQALQSRGEPLACYEAALIVENGLADTFRPLVVVAAPESVQVTRAMTRDGMSEAEARARVAAQMPLSTKVALADHVIDNTGSLEELRRRADEVLDTIAAAHGVDASRYH